MFDVKTSRLAEVIQRMPNLELLDRATAYRAGMQPEAITLIEQELDERGISRGEVAAHDAAISESALWDAHGCAYKCCRCQRPAAVRCWDWHRLYGIIPIFPARFYYCPMHSPIEDDGEDRDDEST